MIYTAHPPEKDGEVLYEYFGIRYGVFLSILREPLLSPKRTERILIQYRISNKIATQAIEKYTTSNVATLHILISQLK